MKNGLVALVSGLVFFAGYAFAGSSAEVLGISHQEPALKVIEERCLFCHNRQRIDFAIKDRQEMEKVLKKMEEKGAALTDRERQVMGHFWKKDPFRSEPVK